jgi:Fe-S cluster assembly protein SufD
VTLTYLIVLAGPCQVDLTFVGQAGSSVEAAGAFLARPDYQISGRIHAQLAEDRAAADLHMVSFLPTGAKCEIDGGVTIDPDTAGCAGHLLEDNIIIGEQMQIKTLPMLDVRSSDVQASHGAKIHRLDPQKLFYLQSKGLPLAEAKRLMLEASLTTLFERFPTDQVAKLKEHRLAYLLAGL